MARSARFRVVAPGSAAANPAFDVTPARLVTGLITERGVAPASGEGLARLFPDWRAERRHERGRRVREEIVAVAQAIDRAGFCPSKSGNVSARFGDGFLITPVRACPMRRRRPTT